MNWQSIVPKIKTAVIIISTTRPGELWTLLRVNTVRNKSNPAAVMMGIAVLLGTMNNNRYCSLGKKMP